MLYYLLCITFFFSFSYNQRISLQVSFFTFLTILGSCKKRKQELYFTDSLLFVLLYHSIVAALFEVRMYQINLV